MGYMTNFDKNIETIIYVDRIKERLVYFSQNIGYTFDFYTMKENNYYIL